MSITLVLVAAAYVVALTALTVVLIIKIRRDS